MSGKNNSIQINSIKLESHFPDLPKENGGNRFLRGKEANLSSLRSCQIESIRENDYVDFRSNNTSIASKNKSEKQDEVEKMLCFINCIKVTLKSAHEKYEGATGYLIISTKRVFFIASDAKDTEKDFVIDAQLVSLHAMMSEPSHSVYCQLADDNEEDEDTGPSEISFYPHIMKREETEEGVNDIEEKKRKLNQLLFDSFTELINLNPVVDDNQNDGTGFMEMLGMLNGKSQFDVGDEMVFVTGRDEFHEENNVSSSSDERNQMLERLDNLLVVPPEYELDGQFDDADEEEPTDDEVINNIL